MKLKINYLQPFKNLKNFYVVQFKFNMTLEIIKMLYNKKY